eukprot:GHVT01016341.1.p1 GENE.GHVT01016341.1~~GHVT01016341.1.p1  ORF type:complete len:1297 (+),score=210.58 GHVT01016341.1:217-3891(+)
MASDSKSMENAIILEACKRWPLIIDPQGAGRLVVKSLSELRRIRLTTCSLSDAPSVVLHRVETAMTSGSWVLIQVSSRDLVIPAPLRWLLDLNEYQYPDGTSVRVGPKILVRAPAFRVFFLCCSSVPSLRFEYFSRLAPVDFSLTTEGLLQRVLQLAVSVERPSLAAHRSESVSRLSALKDEASKMDSKILELLSKDEADLLENEEAIDLLCKFKQAASSLSLQIAEEEVATREIDATRETYEPLAARASLLFFCVQNLAGLHVSYRYPGLQWFLQLFVQTINENKPPISSEDDHHGDDDVKPRCEILTDAFTDKLYRHVARSLFSRHRLVFAFDVAAKVAIEGGRLDKMLVDIFLYGPPSPKEMALEDKNEGGAQSGLDSNSTNLSQANDVAAENHHGSDSSSSNPALMGRPSWVSVCQWKSILWLASRLPVAFGKLPNEFANENSPSTSPNCSLEVESDGSSLSDEETERAGGEGFTPDVCKKEEVGCVSGRGRTWKNFMQSPSPTVSDVPKRWRKNRTNFHVLLLFRHLRVARLCNGLEWWIRKEMGRSSFLLDRSSTCGDDLSSVLPSSAPNVPILLLVAPGGEHISELLNFAPRQATDLGVHTPSQNGGLNIGNTYEPKSDAEPNNTKQAHGQIQDHNYLAYGEKLVDIIAIGPGLSRKATTLIERATAAGRWVIIQNIELLPSWLPQLEELVNNWQPEQLHHQFRLLLMCSTSGCRHVPDGLLAVCAKVTMESPAGLQAAVLDAGRRLNSWKHLAEDSNWSEEKKQAYKQVLIRLCYFHAAVQEKIRVDPVGFVDIDDLSADDLHRAIMIVRNVFATNGDSVHIQPLHHYVLTMAYGSRIHNPHDFGMLKALAQQYLSGQEVPCLFSSSSFSTATASSSSGIASSSSSASPVSSSSFSSSSSHSLSSPCCSSCSASSPYSSSTVFSSLRDFEGLFSAHASYPGGEDVIADPSLGHRQSKELLLALQQETRQVAPPSSSVERAAEFTSSTRALLGRLPAPLFPADGSEVEKKGLDPSNQHDCEETPICRVLAKEGHKYDKLIRLVHSTLSLLLAALEGRAFMTSGHWLLLRSIMKDELPLAWRRQSSAAPVNLAGWMKQLEERVEYLRGVVGYPLPGAMWIGALMAPQAFILAVVQNHSRVHSVALDQVELEVHVLSHIQDADDIHAPPPAGVYLKRLWLRGASWNRSQQTLVRTKYTQCYLFYTNSKPLKTLDEIDQR